MTADELQNLETQLATLIGPEFFDRARAVLPELFAEIRALRSERDRVADQCDELILRVLPRVEALEGKRTQESE